MAFAVNMDAWRLGNSDYWKDEDRERLARLDAAAAEKQSWERQKFENEQGDRARRYGSVAGVLGAMSEEDRGAQWAQQFYAKPDPLGLDPQVPAAQGVPVNPAIQNATTGPTAVTNNVVTQGLANTGTGVMTPAMRAAIERDIAKNGNPNPSVRIDAPGTAPPQAAPQSQALSRRANPATAGSFTPAAEPVAPAQGLQPQQPAPQFEGPMQPAPQPAARGVAPAEVDPRLNALKLAAGEAYRAGDMKSFTDFYNQHHSVRLQNEMGSVARAAMQMSPSELNSVMQRMGGDLESGMRGVLLESKFDPNTGMATLAIGDKKIQVSRPEMATILSGVYAIERGAAKEGHAMISSVSKDIAALASANNKLVADVATGNNKVVHDVAAMKNDTARTEAVVGSNAASASLHNTQREALVDSQGRAAQAFAKVEPLIQKLREMTPEQRNSPEGRALLQDINYEYSMGAKTPEGAVKALVPQRPSPTKFVKNDDGTETGYANDGTVVGNYYNGEQIPLGTSVQTLEAMKKQARENGVQIAKVESPGDKGILWKFLGSDGKPYDTAEEAKYAKPKGVNVPKKEDPPPVTGFGLRKQQIVAEANTEKARIKAEQDKVRNEERLRLLQGRPDLQQLGNRAFFP